MNNSLLNQGKQSSNLTQLFSFQDNLDAGRQHARLFCTRPAISLIALFIHQIDPQITNTCQQELRPGAGVLGSIQHQPKVPNQLTLLKQLIGNSLQTAAG